MALIFKDFREALARKGPSYIIRRVFPYFITVVKTHLELLYYKSLRPKSFYFRGRNYRYAYHRYNTTWRNERCVEVPILWRYVRGRVGRILEVGNVLSHYFKITHDVIDKYEKWPGVVNEDIVDFETKEPYDLIVSISTLEHVGYDEPVKAHDKIFCALKNLIKNTKLGGQIIVTLPIDHNSEVDNLIITNLFNEKYFLRRSKRKEWVESSLEEAFTLSYDHKIPSANAVFIGVINVTENIDSTICGNKYSTPSAGPSTTGVCVSR